MRTLAVDCATAACSVALFEDQQLIAGHFELIERGHAERLVPLIATLPGKGRASQICVSLGPGSFTGVRIGLAAARALGLAWGAQVLGYPTLALVAAMANADHAGPLGVAMLGGHGEWFVQSYDAAGNANTALASLTPDRAASVLTDAVVVGSAAEALVARRGNGIARPLLPDARRFALLPKSALTTALSPIYGRGPDATLQRPVLPATKPAGHLAIAPDPHG